MGSSKVLHPGNLKGSTVFLRLRHTCVELTTTIIIRCHALSLHYFSLSFVVVTYVHQAHLSSAHVNDHDPWIRGFVNKKTLQDRERADVI